MAKVRMDESTSETAAAGKTEAVSRADARNALLGALDEINVGNSHSFKMTRSDITLIWGESAFRDGTLRPGYEYKGLPVELDE